MEVRKTTKSSFCFAEEEEKTNHIEILEGRKIEEDGGREKSML